MCVVDRYNYGCAAAKNGGACSSKLTVNRRKAETAMLAGVRDILLSEPAQSAYQRAVARQMKARADAGTDSERRLAQARTERDNVMAAIRAGIITESTKAELQRLESVIAELERPRPAQMVPNLRGRLADLAHRLADRATEKPAVREILRGLIGEAVATKENGVTGAMVTPQIELVAGAGFEPYLRPVFVPFDR